MNKEPITTKTSALPLIFKTTFIAWLLPTFLLLLSIQTSHAGSATWKMSPSSGDWDTASNWTPATIPNGSSDTATFAASDKTGVSLSQFTQLDRVVFNADAGAFTIDTGSQLMDILGLGITNNSGIQQNFISSGLGEWFRPGHA